MKLNLFLLTTMIIASSQLILASSHEPKIMILSGKKSKQNPLNVQYNNVSRAQLSRLIKAKNARNRHQDSATLKVAAALTSVALTLQDGEPNNQYPIASSSNTQSAPKKQKNGKKSQSTAHHPKQLIHAQVSSHLPVEYARTKE